jgi:hypothetical protein
MHTRKSQTGSEWLEIKERGDLPERMNTCKVDAPMAHANLEGQHRRSRSAAHSRRAGADQSRGVAAIECWTAEVLHALQRRARLVAWCSTLMKREDTQG